MILKTLDRLSDGVYRWAGRSRFFARVSELCASRKSCGEGFCKRRRFYRSVLYWQERGAIFRAKRWFTERLLAARTSDLGVFLLAFGGVGLLGNWFYRGESPFSWRILLPLICILLSPILLNSSASVARSIRRSVLLRRFLFDFCRLSQTHFVSKKQVRPPKGAFVAVGFLIGLLNVWISPVWITLAFLGAILLLLLSAVPELAYCCVFALLPFLNLAPHPTLLLTAILSGGLLLCLGKTFSGKRQGEWGRADGLVLWLCTLFLIGSVASYGSLYEGALRAFLLFAGWFPIRVLFSSPLWRKRATVALAASSCVSAIGGVAEYLLGKATLGWVDVSRFGDIGGRVCGFFGNPNIFAVFLLLTAPLSLGVALRQKTLFGRLFWGMAFVAQSLCLILTWSRGAWLGWMLALMLFLALCSRRTLSWLFAFGTFGFGLVFYFPDNVLRRFQSIGSVTDSSAHYRANTWRGVLRMLQSHPFGIGSGESAFRSVFPSYAVSGTETVMHAHQILLEVAVEIGAVGVILFLLLLLRFFASTVRFCRGRAEGECRAEGVCLLSALAGALVMGLFDSLWYHLGLYWLFWSVAALLWNVLEEGFDEQNGFRA